MRVLVLAVRLWLKGLLRGDTAADAVMRWGAYLLVTLVALGISRTSNYPVSISVVVFNRELITTETNLGVVMAVGLFTIFAVYEAGVAWTKARWLTPRVELLHDPACLAC